MAEYEQTKCTQCDAPFGETIWRGVLPWWFCSKQCAVDYHQKDGPVAVELDKRATYTPRGEGQAGGWIRVGRYDLPRRRALWVRFVGLDDSGLLTKCGAIEMCSGREGDDAIVRIETDNPVYHELLEVMLRAADHIPARWEAFDAREHKSESDGTVNTKERG